MREWKFVSTTVAGVLTAAIFGQALRGLAESEKNKPDKPQPMVVNHEPEPTTLAELSISGRAQKIAQLERAELQIKNTAAI